jgi:hypothetical protein
LVKVIPMNTFAFETWLADSSHNIAVANVGVALLSAQITGLESRCRAMHNRIEIKRAKENVRQQKTHKRRTLDTNFKSR